MKTPVSRHDLQIRVLQTLAELEVLRADWETLLATLPNASIFSSWEWLAPWWRAFGDSQNLHVLSLQNSASGLAGIAPLSFTTTRSAGFKWKVVRLMGDGSQDSDNLDLPVLPEYEEEFFELVLGHLEKHSNQWDFCEWNTVPESSSLSRYLPTCLKRRNWLLITTRTPCSSVILPGTWELYLKQLSAKERKKFGNLTRRLENIYPVRYRRVSRIQDLDCDLESLFDLHKRRWETIGRSGSFNSPARRRFYRDLAETLLLRNQLEFWLLDLNGRPAAAQFGFRFGTTVYALQEGFDPDFAKDSVGYVLRAHVMRALISEGVRKYDFLGGVSDSKNRWGAEVGSYLNFRFCRPHSLGGTYVRARRDVEFAKERLRHRLPPQIWQILHNLKMKLRRRGVANS